MRHVRFTVIAALIAAVCMTAPGIAHAGPNSGAAVASAASAAGVYPDGATSSVAVGNLNVAGTAGASTQCPVGAVATGLRMTVLDSDSDMQGIALKCSDGSVSPVAGGSTFNSVTTHDVACTGEDASGISVAWGAVVGGLAVNCPSGGAAFAPGERAAQGATDCAGGARLTGVTVRWAPFQGEDTLRSVAALCTAFTARIGNTGVADQSVAEAICPAGAHATGLQVSITTPHFVAGVAMVCSDGTTTPVAGDSGDGADASTCGQRAVGITGRSGDIQDNLGARCVDLINEVAAGTSIGDGGGNDDGFTDCPGDTSLVGVIVWHGTYFSHDTVSSARGICGPESATVPLTSFGTSLFDQRSLLCPSGSHAIGVNGLSASGAVNDVTLICSDGSATGATDTNVSGCESGDSADGLYARGASATVWIGVHCRDSGGSGYFANDGSTAVPGVVLATCPARLVGLSFDVNNLNGGGLSVSGVTGICASTAIIVTESVAAKRIAGLPTTVQISVAPATDTGFVGGTIDMYADGRRIVAGQPVFHDADSLTFTASADHGTNLVTVYSGSHDNVRAVSEPRDITATVSDVTPPTGSLHALPLATLATSLKLAWTGADDLSGVDHFALRTRVASATGAFGAWTTPPSLAHLTGHSVTVTGRAPGSTNCYELQAVDRVGNASAWGAPQCTAVAVDDRALTASTGWKRATSTAWWHHTATTTTTKNASLTRAGIRLDRVGVVATTCPTCGTLSISVGSKHVGTINLGASSTHRQVLLLLPKFATLVGTVHVTVTSAGKVIQIDGLLTSQA